MGALYLFIYVFIICYLSIDGEMILRRASCVFTTVAITLRYSRFLANLTITTRETTTRTTTTTPPTAKTLWCSDAVFAAEESAIVTVEDMFGHMEGEGEWEEEVDEECGHVGSHDLSLDCGMERGASGARAGDEVLTHWAAESIGGGSKGVEEGDVMSVSLHGPRIFTDCGAADMTFANSGEPDGDSVNNNGGNDNDADSYVRAARVCKDSEGDDDDDMSAILAEEEEERVERLLHAMKTTEHVGALFFNEKHQTVRRTVPKVFFDDAAAEGAELESVGETMPSPGRF